MSGSWDATVKAVTAVEKGTANTVDVIESGKTFDVLVDIEVGKGIIAFGGASYRLVATVRNQSQFTVAYAVPASTAQLPSTGTGNFQTQLRINVPDTTWSAAEDDVLDVIASFSLKSGQFTDTTSETSRTFIVSA
ncbi:hypothetical protein [Frankia sp. AgKG'84/4]|uniref:hypothetical protein n=1 Tax=Frankia sp. AgKG'84/4 TaxID=573490 RepID=UPI00201085B9|nr:hypothetical protein [Frankia sp. AgKG'84/4]MCL9795836.1 hypothetical protein [Frankia sp. AgKG'84/4]